MRSLAILSAVALTGVSVVAQGTQIPIPGFTRTFSGSAATRGFYFQAPLAFVISGLRVPDETAAGVQNVEVFVMPTQPPAYPASANTGSMFYSANQPSANILASSVLVAPNEWVGVLGACGTATMANSYGGPFAGGFASTVLGAPITLDRFLTQTNLNTSGGGQAYSTENGFDISRVEVYASPAAGFATATPYGAGCGGDGPASYYELFDGASPNDLGGGATGITMIFGGSSYIVLPTSTNGFVAPTGSAIAFGDDDNQSFPLPNPMPTPSGPITDIGVCSNGFIDLGPSSNADFSESVVELLQATTPRLAVYWDDFNPSAAGSMFVEPDPTNPAVIHVTWDQVTEYGVTNANTFQASLDTISGIIEINYGAMASLDGLVGYSPGAGAADPGGVDITALGAGGLVLGTGAPDLQLLATTRPVQLTNGIVDAVNINGGAVAGAFLLGTTQLNVDLGLIGMTGCSLLTDGGLISTPMVIAGSTAQLSVPINSAPVGLTVTLQAFTIVPGANALGVTSSNGVEWVVDIN